LNPLLPWKRETREIGLAAVYATTHAAEFREDIKSLYETYGPIAYVAFQLKFFVSLLKGIYS